jgi:RHS repeat-associated protein
MKPTRLLAMVFLAGCISLYAQTAPDLENGFKNYGSYDSTHLDTVNLMNGNLILHAPLLPNYPQRGKLNLQLALTFNAKTWQVICVNNASNLPECGWFHGGTGITLQRPTDLGIQRTIQNFFNGSEIVYLAQGYSLTGADGASHQLLPITTTAGVYMELESIDTSGYHVMMSGADANGVPNIATITDRSGNRYVATFDVTGACGALPYNAPLPWAGGTPMMNSGFAPMIDDAPSGSQFCPQLAGTPAITDSNGNVIQTYDPANNLYPGSDTLGRAIPLETITLTSDYSGCVSANPITGAYLASYNAPDGTSRQIKMCYGPVPMQTAFNQSGVVEYPGGPSLAQVQLQPGNQIPTLSTVILADGTKWTFAYDNYGEINSVSLPTGGSITYTWTTIGLNNNCSGQTLMSRAVTTRTLNDGQGNSSTWTYSWGSPAGVTVKNTVNDPLHNDTVHIFTAVDGLCAFYETSTQFYRGSKDANQLLKQVDTSYYPPLLVTTDSGDIVAGNVVAKDIITTVNPSGKVSKIHREYDQGLGTNKPIFGNIVKEQEYDWGQGAAGALLRETDTVYQWQKADASGNHPYLTADMLDLPASTVVISPNAAENNKTACPINSGSATTNCISETDYAYDEPAYFTVPTPAVTTQHNSTPPNGVRGNLTTVSRWLNTTSSMISSHTNWYDTGERYQTSDPLGHTTTYTYDPAYIGGYVTQTCSPTTNNGSITHCVSGTYDFNTGVLTSLTNENATTQAAGTTQGDSSHTGNYSYDYMFRITSAQAPPDPANGGARSFTNFSFSAPNTFPISVQRSKSITTSLSDSATNLFDGLARAYQGQHVLPNGTATVDTTFDSAGHPATASNPYFSTSDPTYGITTNTYDALDRVTQTTKQDGSISSVSYNVAVSAPGDCTETKDEAGKQRRTCSDALGRLIEVDEPGDTFSGSPSTGSLTISGTLASQSGVGEVGANYATAQVTITGDDQDDFTPGHQECINHNCFFIPAVNIYDSGTIGLTINGGTAYTATFSSTVDNSPSNLANVIVSAMANDPSVIVTNVSSGTNGSGIEYATISLQAKNAGTSGNSITVSTSYTYNSTLFSSSSFVTGSSSGTLAGGTASNPGVTVYDQGNVSATVSGFTATVPYSQTGNSTAAQVASALATALSVSSSPVTATSSGGQVTLTYKSVGPAGNVGVAVTSQSTQTQATFPANAFTGSGTLSGGFSSEGSSLDFNYFVTQYSYDGLGNLLQVTQKGDPSVTNSSQWRVRNFTYDSLGRLLTAVNPESGTISYTYNADSELLQKTSPAPNQTGTVTQTVSFCYDELHRVIGKGYGAQTCPLATPVVTYTYDSAVNAKGKLVSLTDQAGTATYGYDILGRMTAETRTLTGANNAAISKNLTYSYNLDGSLKTLTYPSGAAVTYTPGAAGLTLSAVDSGNGINYATGATYGPDSALTGFVSGYNGTFAGITSAFSYNKRLQPVNMSATAPNQTVYSIGYDFHVGNGTTGADNGNVFGITNYKDTTHGRDQTFTYDSLNRLTSAQNAGTDCTAMVLQNKTEYWGNSYGYDAWGNMLSKAITKCGAEHLLVTADTHNWIHATGLPDYQYDAAGNMTYDATASLNYSFDQENRLTGADGYTYTYDGDGNRVRKSNGNLAANGTLYWAMTPGVVAETDLAGTLKSEYVFFEGERVARRDGVNGAGGVFYYFSDHLKTASVVTDSAGNIKAESDYYPWGGELQFTNNDSNHYKFTGKERDETGLDYFGARYYSNGLGRWVSADWSPTPIPVPYADFGDPQSLNLYGYVRNIPTTGFDAGGHCDSGLLCDLGKGAAIGLQRANELISRGNDAVNRLLGRSIPRPGGDAEAAETGKGNVVPQIAVPENKTQEVTATVTSIVVPALIPGEEEGAALGVGEYEVGSYGELSGRSPIGDGLTLDHIPSNASNLARATAAKGEALTPTEANAVRNQGTAVAVPDAAHRSASPTYGGRNTEAQIQADAANPQAAAARDTQAMVNAASANNKAAASAAATKICQAAECK